MKHVIASVRRPAAAVAVLIAAIDSGFAQETGNPAREYGYYHGHGMFWDGGHMGGFGMIFGSLFMVLLLIAVVAAVVLLMRSFGGAGSSTPIGPTRQEGNRALDILKERFANGEIDAKEFDERKRLLSD